MDVLLSSGKTYTPTIHVYAWNYTIFAALMQTRNREALEKNGAQGAKTTHKAQKRRGKAPAASLAGCYFSISIVKSALLRLRNSTMRSATSG